MLQCWSEQQLNRPSFSELRLQFDQFLSVYVQEHYPYIELQSSNQCDETLQESTNQVAVDVADTSSTSTHDLQTVGQFEDHEILSPPKGFLAENKERAPRL